MRALSPFQLRRLQEEWPEPISAPAVLAPWHALYVESMQERAVEGRLDESRVEHFCPFVSIPTPQRTDRRSNLQRTEVPLLPGYVFARVNPEENVYFGSVYLPVAGLPGVLHMVGRGAEPEPIPDIEIESLRKLVLTGRNFRREAYEPKLGEEVEILCGAMAGYRGIVTVLRGECRVKVSIHGLALSVSAEVDAADVRPVNADADATGARATTGRNR